MERGKFITWLVTAVILWQYVLKFTTRGMEWTLTECCAVWEINMYL
jgi:hypothetical protein